MENKNHTQRAVELFLGGYNCSQSVFAAFCDITGMTEETALMLASPLGGGMGRLREVCGACSGMFLVLGAVRGYAKPDDNAKKELYGKVQELAAKFRKINGTIICRELLGEVSDSPVPTVRTPEYYKSRPCAKFVEDAARIIEEELTLKSN